MRSRMNGDNTSAAAGSSEIPVQLSHSRLCRDYESRMGKFYRKTLKPGSFSPLKCADGKR